MAEHRCDRGLLDQSGSGPLTSTRALRLIQACSDSGIADRDAALRDVLAEFARCPNCVLGVLLYLAGFTGSVVREGNARFLSEVDMLLAAALDELGAADA